MKLKITKLFVINWSSISNTNWSIEWHWLLSIDIDCHWLSLSSITCNYPWGKCNYKLVNQETMNTFNWLIIYKIHAQYYIITYHKLYNIWLFVFTGCFEVEKLGHHNHMIHDWSPKRPRDMLILRHTNVKTCGLVLNFPVK